MSYFVEVPTTSLLRTHNIYFREVFILDTGKRSLYKLANSEYPDKMPHNAAFH